MDAETNAFKIPARITLTTGLTGITGIDGLRTSQISKRTKIGLQQLTVEVKGRQSKRFHWEVHTVLQLKA